MADCGISVGEQKILEQKAQRRAELRQEFLKQSSNPFRHGINEGGTVYDRGMLRFTALKSTGYDHFRPSGKNFINLLLFAVLPISIYAYCLKTERDGREEKYRTGQVAYKDRRFKWI